MRKQILGLFLLLLAGVLYAGEVEVPRLSPLPERVMEERVPLSGQWWFNPAPEAEFWEKETVKHWKPIEVPGEWVMQGFEVEKGKAAGYFRTFTVPASWQGKRIKLRCNAIYSDARVYINGQKAGSHLGGFTAFELDVTDWVRCGAENRMAVAVTSETVADSTSNASRYAVHPLGGISRDLYLFALPETNLSLFHVSTAFDSTYTDATLVAEVDITHEGKTASGKYQLAFELKDAEDRPVRLKDDRLKLRELAAGETEKLTVRFPVTAPRKWDPEHPYLYRLTCRLMDGNRVMQTSVRRVGFRQIEVRGNQVFVNNHPIKLRGACHHEVMPLRGRSVNNDMWRRDVELFREGNVNYLRTSHYPPDEALLEACDELGMFVEVEAPFCWAHEAKVPDALRQDILVNQHLAMVNLNRSHPSVLMWSMGNESNLYAEYFKEAAGLVKQIDPTRPRIFSQWGPDADQGELEVTNHHYPGPEGPDKYRNYSRPVVFDEFCHLNAYNRLELAADPGLRNMWGVLLDRMWNAMYHSQGVLGGAIWAGIDDTFFLPGERAVGYGTWGPIDGWRRPKPEYWGMKKAFSPVKIRLKGNQDADGKLCFEVENRHLFSNLKETRLEWTVGNQHGVVTPDVAPGKTGEFTVQLPEEVRSAGTIDWKVIGVRGFEIDAYHFQTLPEPLAQPALLSAGRIQTEETDEAYVIRTISGDFQIDKRNGLLTSSKNNGAVLVKAPELMVLPLNAEGEGIQMVGKDQKFEPYTPVCSRWIARKIGKTGADDDWCIRVEGTYAEAEGYFEYRFRATGEVEVTYHFTLLEAVSPRQVGLVFSLPKTYDHIQWRRRGYWSVYPENHLGSLSGEAVAYDPSLPVSGLAGPSKQPAKAWSFDQTAAGSNLFRATKENIYEATLSGAAASRVKVLSDGTQHIRAWRAGEEIRFLVADYNNAGNDTFLTSHSRLDFRPLKRGDQISGTVTLRIL